jgi:hypothetical protein
VPKLFEVSISLAGSQKDDTWFFDQVSFLFRIGEDQSGMQGTANIVERRAMAESINWNQTFPESQKARCGI